MVSSSHSLPVPLGRDITEGSTVAYRRATLVDSGTAANILECLYNGNRTTYFNEYGELRVIAAANNTVAVRIKRKSDSATANLIEVTDLGNNVLGGFDVNGNPFAPTPTWVDLTLPAGMSHSTVHAACRSEPFGIVRVRGSITSDNGTGFTAGVTIATLPAGKRPAAAMTLPSRQATAGIALSIGTDGAITSSSTIGTGGGIVVLLDNIAFSTT